jgi:hypothetical protein
MAMKNTNKAAQSTCLSLTKRNSEVGVHILHCERGFESSPGGGVILLSRLVRNNHVP